MLDPFFTEALQKAQDGWRRTVALAAKHGIPVTTFSNALSFYDSYRCARLPANLLQAQRDYFGAHTYERTDKPRGQFFHSNWTGQGGTVSSSTYNA
jgi:6-phosphogluconate dehydrogenase